MLDLILRIACIGVLGYVYFQILINSVCIGLGLGFYLF